MHTGDTSNPWWAVDLGGNVKVKKIEVYQRIDSCCGKSADCWMLYICKHVWSVCFSLMQAVFFFCFFFLENDNTSFNTIALRMAKTPVSAILSAIGLRALLSV